MMYLAIQDNKILGVYKTRAEAEVRVRSEIENDKLKHILKRTVAKKILAGKAKIPAFEDRYVILNVVESEEVYKFDPWEDSNV